MSRSMIEAVRTAAEAHYGMRLDGIHGREHWERVRDNGVRLVKEGGGDLVVVELFAYLHDCCRQSDGHDPKHGMRAALFAKSLRGDLLHLTDDQFECLSFACEHHTGGGLSDDLTVGACWDADRLDLGRVGLFPERRYLSTEGARDEEVIEWAYRRSVGDE